MSEHIIIYITASDEVEARQIGEVLVTKKLVACVNILGEVSSIFHWKGIINNEKEVALIAKSKASLLPKIIEEVKAVHSYECPCIVALPIVGGNEEFLNWISEETL